MFPFSSGWHSLPTHHNNITFRVDRQIYSYISLFDMVQIKLSVALILAAAAIAPVVALPAPKGGAST